MVPSASASSMAGVADSLAGAAAARRSVRSATAVGSAASGGSAGEGEAALETGGSYGVDSLRSASICWRTSAASRSAWASAPSWPHDIFASLSALDRTVLSCGRTHSEMSCSASSATTGCRSLTMAKCTLSVTWRSRSRN